MTKRGDIVTIGADADRSTEDVVTTGLSVFDGEASVPVYLTQVGRFAVIASDGSRVERDSYDALVTYMNGVVERREKQKREAARPKPLPVTILNGRGIGNDHEPADVDIKGVSVDGNRVLFKHVGGRPLKVVNAHDTLYRRFTDAERAEWRSLRETLAKAMDACAQFEHDRRIGGHARTVAQAIEDGDDPLALKKARW